MILNINSDAVVKHTNKLESLKNSALPTAIVGTLNDAVYDVKTNTMPKKANEFVKRQENFFKANSKFEKAKGLDIKTMRATVGFFENKLVNAGTNYAVKDLEQQEEGGVIKKKSLIAMKGARVNDKKVKANLRIRDLRNRKFVETSSSGKDAHGNTITGLSLKQQFVRAAIYANSKFGKNALVLSGNGSNKTLSEVKFNKRGFNTSSKAIYSVKKGRSVHVQATKFMRRASLETAKKLGVFFITQAERQFAKFNK
jgi:hypothetical protein